jgi:hypothetical protein
MSASVVLDARGRRRSPATMPGYHAGRSPRNRGSRYPPDPPRVDEIAAVMRAAGGGAHGARARGLIVVLWRAGLRRALEGNGASGGPKPLLLPRENRSCNEFRLSLRRPRSSRNKAVYETEFWFTPEAGQQPAGLSFAPSEKRNRTLQAKSPSGTSWYRPGGMTPWRHHSADLIQRASSPCIWLERWERARQDSNL